MTILGTARKKNQPTQGLFTGSGQDMHWTWGVQNTVTVGWEKTDIRQCCGHPCFL